MKKITNEYLKQKHDELEILQESAISKSVQRIMSFIAVLYTHALKYMTLKHIQEFNIGWIGSLKNAYSTIKKEAINTNVMIRASKELADNKEKLFAAAIEVVINDNPSIDTSILSDNCILVDSYFPTIREMTDEENYIRFLKKYAYNQISRDICVNKFKEIK